MEVIPEVISAAQLEGRVGHVVTCPLCQSQRTSDAADVGWVAMPELRQEPRWVCLGSWLDVSSIARADRPAEHPYHDDLRRLAALAGMSVDHLTRSLLQRQLAILQARPPTADDHDRAELEGKIEMLLGHAHR